MADNREQRMQEIMEKLEQGVKELFTSEKYTEYLKTMSQFHKYSFNSTVLIAMQKPDATLVAGYQAWQKKFNRHVRRGEKAIQIIAPVPVKEKQEMEKIDPETQEPLLRPDGQPETEEVEVVIPRFRAASVFDVSQTEGDPLPGLDTPELMGSVENYPAFMRAIEKVSPAPIRFDVIDSEAKGFYNSSRKEIVIREGMSESQNMKTAVHEVTHALLHDRELMEESGEKKDKMTKEVEAESVAFAVCQYFGLDTSDYSFPYIAGWSSGMEMNELRSSMDTIRRTAGKFIDDMAEAIQDIQREAEREAIESAEEYQEVELFEAPTLFSIGRIAPEDAPEGFYCYDLRGSDYDPGEPVTVENRAVVNHAGSVLTTVPLPVPERGFLRLGEELNFTGGMVTAAGFLEGQKGADRNLIAEKMENAICRSNEEIVLSADPSYDRYAIYQINEDAAEHDYLFRNMDAVKAMGWEVRGSDYSFVYGGALTQRDTLDGLFERFNTSQPEGYSGHSLSVSDVVVMARNGEAKAFYVDSFGFKELPEFIAQRLRMMQPEQEEAGQKAYPPVYLHDLAYAKEHGAADEYFDSRKLNMDCRKAIEDAIRGNFDGMHLNYGAAAPVLEEYGAERVTFVLANTLQQEGHDGRFSRANKEWAGKFTIPEDRSRGMDLNADYVVSSHPAVLDGFIGLARSAMQETEKVSILQYYVVNDAYGIKAEREYQFFPTLDAALDAYSQLPNHLDKGIGMESTEAPHSRMPLISCRNGIERTEDIEAASLSGKWVTDKTMGALRRAEYYLDNRDAEIAYRIDRQGGKFFTIQTTADGYDYTFYDAAYKELDGGAYDNMDVSMEEAINEILADEGLSMSDCTVTDYDELSARLLEAGKEEIRRGREEAEKQMPPEMPDGEKQAGLPQISDRTEPETALNGQSPSAIEETVLCHAQACLESAGLAEDVELLGARVYGSRSREGLYTEKSDVDVALSYSGDIREDAFFNMLHEGGLEIAGMPVDINPISVEKTGTLEEYMENAEKYLDMKEEQIQEMGKSPSPEPEKTPEKPISQGMDNHPGKRQSVLEALRERQARIKAQEKESHGKNPQARREKGAELE